VPEACLTTIVVPCYNEAKRLPVATFRAFAAAHPDVGFLFVNDGSRDETPKILKDLAESDPGRFAFLDQPENRGKAEAVRRGVLHVLRDSGRPAGFVGYWDADLATPLEEVPRFLAALEAHPEREACFGARVQLLGRRIERRALRHYLGRVFATVASLMLELPVYDTQCGAKLFRANAQTEALFAEPFLVSWTFDVEVIARMRVERARRGLPAPSQVIYELPLDVWHDVAGSKVRPGDFVKALFEMLRIFLKYRS
jgi:dolichyl-phosphate beta-glucosyltransferase